LGSPATWFVLTGNGSLDKAHERAPDLIRQAISTVDGRPLTLDRQSAMIEQTANENAAERLHAIQFRAAAVPQVRREWPAQRPSPSDRGCPLVTARDRACGTWVARPTRMTIVDTRWASRTLQPDLILHSRRR
jgi:hypothetical protein